MQSNHISSGDDDFLSVKNGTGYRVDILNYTNRYVKPASVVQLTRTSSIMRVVVGVQVPTKVKIF